MRILVWNDKHGDYFYAADTLEQLDAACRQIIKQRLDQGYFWNPDRDVDTALVEAKRADASVTDEEIAALPGGYEVKAEAEKARNRARATIKNYEDEWADTREARDILAADTSLYEGTVNRAHPDGWHSRAYDLLVKRDCGEYEGIQFESVWEAS